jgi:Uma2 family endonuclease
MVSSVKPRLYTPAEYLERERKAECKSEYLAGRIYAMAGATRRHNLIAMNTGSALNTRLSGRPCEVYGSDMRIRVDASGLYTYPDVTVVCGTPRFEDAQEDTLLNPTVLIEVLSKTTEAYDRGDKFAHYRTLDSLMDYVLITQAKARIEHYRRQPDGRWLLTEVMDLQGTVRLDSIDCTLAPSEVYDKATFPADEEGRDAGEERSQGE